jgi:hypothetical protein
VLHLCLTDDRLAWSLGPTPLAAPPLDGSAELARRRPPTRRSPRAGDRVTTSTTDPPRRAPWRCRLAAGEAGVADAGQSADAIELLLVHRPKYDDAAQGKHEPGESDECARQTRGWDHRPPGAEVGTTRHVDGAAPGVLHY